MSNQVKIGTVVGTGAAINVSLGWQPDYIEIVNITSAAGFEKAEWFSGMANPSAYKTVATGVRTKLAATGLGLYPGTASANSEGFTIGADADLNVVAETIAYRVVRN